MTSFAIATIESGAERFEGTFSEVWYGRMRALSSQSAFPVYFKMLPAREFWVETACLRFSEAAGLPVGECYWGKVSRSDLPDSNQWQPGEEQRVTIAVRAGSRHDSAQGAVSGAG